MPKRVIRRVAAFCLLLGLTAGPAGAQQGMPRLLRQLGERPGLNLKAGHMTQDRRGRLWIASNDGVACFDGRQFRVYHDPLVKQGDYYYLIVPAPDGRIWPKMGRGQALAYIDPNRRRMIRLPDSTRLVRDYLIRYGCHFIAADAAGNLWIGLKKKGLLRFNPRTLAVDHLVDRSLDVRGIALDKQGKIYFTTVDQGLFAYTPRTNTLVNYAHNPQDTTSLGSNATYGVSVRPDGRIMVGLVNEVDLLTPATGRIERLRLNAIRSPNPLLADYIYDFHHDARGNAYFTTGAATFCYTHRNELQRIVFSSPTDFIEGLYVSPANRLWISAAHTLYEYDLNRVRAVPSLIVLSAIVNGTQLEGNTATRRLVYDSLGHPTLTVEENDRFSLRFALLASRRSLTIRHRLQPYDREWVLHENYEGIASYQLTGGTYTLRVNRGRLPGGWDSTDFTLTVVVEPPFWKTGYFLALAGLLTGGLAYYLLRTYFRRRQLRKQLLREQAEAAALREMDKLKTRFFSNVTHEFRTPLTIILNATEQLTAKAAASDELPEVATIQRHAHQLLRLITETLDIARLDAGKLEFHPQLGNPVWFIGQVVAQFTGLATQRGLALTYNTNPATLQGTDPEFPLNGTPPDDALFSFDGEKWEKIAYNLLANALKFTPSGGSVQVGGHIRADKRFILQVTDTGIGIPANQQERIFERFHQVDDGSTRAYSGTGIGLALVRELTAWLGGQVTVESQLSQGSTFTVELPLTLPDREHLTHPVAPVDAAPVDAASVDTAALPTLPPAPGRVNTPERTRAVGTGQTASTAAVDTGATPKPLVLVVEDNEDLRAQVVDYLSGAYQVLSAENGRVGWEQALAQVPDLIVSDVMMPELDGYELLERLKADERTSHIPVILLTARSAPESRMQGLQIGADDYLVKPFSLAELVLRIGNGLRTRQLGQKRFLSQSAPAPARLPAEPVPNREDAFVDRLRQAILTQLDSDALDVDWLAARASMSRTQLNRKLSALTSLSPNRFIQRVRLERAAELLQTGELNVTEVAYQVGYNSPSHFAKVFQDHFGYAPAKLKAP